MCPSGDSFPFHIRTAKDTLMDWWYIPKILYFCHEVKLTGSQTLQKWWNVEKPLLRQMWKAALYRSPPVHPDPGHKEKWPTHDFSFYIERKLKYQTHVPTASSTVKLRYLAPTMVFRGSQQMFKRHGKEPILGLPRILDDCTPHYKWCMDGKSLLYTRFSSPEPSFRNKKVRFVLFLRGGATCLQEIISDACLPCG